MGDIVNARKYLLRALEIRKKVLPENHPDLSTSYINVGRTHAYWGENNMTLPYVKKAVSIAEQSLPDGHPDLVYYREIEEQLKFYVG